MKKLILLVIDALTAKVVLPAMEAGRLPHFQALRQAGQCRAECVSIFPSITHAALSSLATGRYPQAHGIAGMNWYDVDGSHAVYYGADFWMVLNKGLDEFLEDFAIKLNHHWLQAETLFQQIERSGRRAACINHLIFRGDVPHEIDTPQLLELLTVAPSMKTVYGPSMLAMGDFIPIFRQIADNPENSQASGGILNRFGLEDDYSADILTQLAKEGKLPDFTLVYFPLNDDISHRVGAEEALSTIEALDAKLGELFGVFGGLPQLLEEYAVMVTGDHAQSDIESEAETAGIRLDDLLADFSIAPVGQPWEEKHQLLICPNLRMAQIYFKQPTPQHVESVIKQLVSEPRVDQVLWRAALGGEESPGYFVTTADRGGLRFWPGMEGPDTAKDAYGCDWSWRGDLAAVDGRVSGEKVLSFPTYPNAFERIAGGLDCPTGGDVWATARPGYEFIRRETSVHNGGGSHGSLHALDSFAPLILAGAPAEVELPARPRLVDIAPLCLTILGLEPPRPVGASHTEPGEVEHS